MRLEDELTHEEAALLARLTTPRRIQDFLDGITYEPDYFNRCPLRVIRERRGHCYDGALFAAITWWLIFSYDAYPALVVASFVVLIASQVTSYVKARGEASGFTILGGLVERPERLIVGLVGVGLQGLGVPYAIDVALWALAAGSVYTVVQRLLTASRNPEALEHIAPPPGTRGADPQGAASR